MKEGVLVKLTPGKVHILLLHPCSNLWEHIKDIKKLSDGLVLPVDPEEVVIIESDTEIEIKVMEGGKNGQDKS